jgi:L-iditol 2-dehydrogenase
MKALVWHGGEHVGLESLPEPLLADGESLLDVRLAGICGSDLHAYRGQPGPRRPPLVLGHEAIGTVAGRAGRFAVFPIVACGHCPACLRGEQNLCERRGLLGLDRQGVFAERVAAPKDALVPLPAGLDDRLGVIAEPLASCLAALRMEQVEAGDRVLVVGGGPIGLLTIYVCALKGVEVSAVEPLPERRLLAERFGAAMTFANVSQAPSGAADVAVDAVGIEETWRGAIAGVRSGGVVAIVGLAQADGKMPVGELVRRGITVRGHYAYVRRDFEAALELLADRPPPLDWLTVMTLEEGAEAFRRLVASPEAVTKILLSIGDQH